MNRLIENEILGRLKRAKENQPDMPSELSPLLECFEKQPLAAVVNVLIEELTRAVAQWSDEDKVQAFGFEWFYDGACFPLGLGYGYAAAKQKTITHKAEPSVSSSVRDNFDGDVIYRENVFFDNTGIDVARACYPLYECRETGLCDEEDDAWDHLQNLFDLRMLLAMHIALKQLAKADIFKPFAISPFYIFANNHDWSPFLVYAESNSEMDVDSLQDSNNLSLEVEELKGWLDTIKQTTLQNNNRAELLDAVRKFSSAELQDYLFDLPDFTAGATTLRLQEGEWVSVCSARLSDPEVLNAISFDALYHLFELTIANDDPNVYRISDALVFLFLKDPCKAKEKILEIYGEFPEKAEPIKNAAKNTLRWANNDPEHRWLNPIFSLSQNTLSQQEMAKILGDD